MQRRLRLVRSLHVTEDGALRRSTNFETALTRAQRRGDPVVYLRLRRRDRLSWWLGYVAGLTTAAVLLALAMLHGCAAHASACRVYVTTDAPINITCD